jgi:hypothetical protein
MRHIAAMFLLGLKATSSYNILTHNHRYDIFVCAKKQVFSLSLSLSLISKRITETGLGCSRQFWALKTSPMDDTSAAVGRKGEQRFMTYVRAIDQNDRTLALLCFLTVPQYLFRCRSRTVGLRVFARV